MFKITPDQWLLSGCWSVAACLAVPAFIQYIDLAMDMDGRLGPDRPFCVQGGTTFPIQGGKQNNTDNFCPAYNK